MTKAVEVAKAVEVTALHGKETEQGAAPVGG
ncbi:hypothetical protein RKD30_003288 [Streptomyces pristinaespiralis]